MEGPLSSTVAKGAVTNGARRFYEFGPFRLDPNRHRLFCGDEIVALSPKAIQTLILLVENRGKLLERETKVDRRARSLPDNGSCGNCVPFCQIDRKSTRLNSSHSGESRMPSSA